MTKKEKNCKIVLIRPNRKKVCFQLHACTSFWPPNLYIAFFKCVFSQVISVQGKKKCYKIIFFLLENAEDNVYLLNQIFESISDLKISKRIWSLPISLFVCVYLPVLSIKKIVHCYFYINKIKNRIGHSNFWMYNWKLSHYLLIISFWP